MRNSVVGRGGAFEGSVSCHDDGPPCSKHPAGPLMCGRFCLFKESGGTQNAPKGLYVALEI